MFNLSFHPWQQPEAFEVELSPSIQRNVHILRFTKDHTSKIYATREQLAALFDALGDYLKEHKPEPSHD